MTQQRDNLKDDVTAHEISTFKRVLQQQMGSIESLVQTVKFVDIQYCNEITFKSIRKDRKTLDIIIYSNKSKVQ